MDDDPHARLRLLIDRSGLSLPAISVKAGVGEQVIQRWYSGRTKNISLISASLIHHALTGKSLIPASVKPLRNKRRAA